MTETTAPPPTATPPETVVDIPATAEHVRVARLAVSALAAAAGFSLDEIEEARIVVGEVAVLLGLETAAPTTRLRFSIRSSDGVVALVAQVAGELPAGHANPYAAAVLEALSAECDVSETTITCTLTSASHEGR